MMSLVSRFVLGYYTRLLGLSCAAFVGIYLLVDFFEKIDKFIDYGADLSDYAGFVGHSIPFIFVQILPLAILTSMVLTLGGLGRTNEMTALRACGISLWRVVRPLIGLIALLCALQLALNEYLVPWNTRELNRLIEIKLEGREEQTRLTQDRIWYRTDNRIVNIRAAQTREQRLEGVTLYQFDHLARIERRLDIPTLRYREDRWYAPHLTERRFEAETGNMIATSRLENQYIDLDRQWSDFSGVDHATGELSIRRLAQLADRLEQEGYDATRQQVDLQARLAGPATSLVMGLLGIPFALQRGRQSNIALGVGLSLAVGAAYFIIQSMVTSFGYAGAIPAVVAAWSGNIIFLLLGVWLFLGVRE